ncbi:hypothetical protein F4703DRAFT_1890433 [Phycomyces blakesleeanus]
MKTSPRLASSRLTSPHLTSPHLTSPHLTSPHLTSPHLNSFQLISHISLAIYKNLYFMLFFLYITFRSHSIKRYEINVVKILGKI